MECLKEHLNDDLFTQVKDALKGNKKVKLVNLKDDGYISKAKFTAKSGEVDTLTEQLETRDGDIVTLQAQLKDVEGIDDVKADLVTLQAKYDGDKATYQEKIISAKASLRVIEMGAKDAKSVLTHVDMTKVTVGDNDILQGLDEQITPIQKSHDFLFGEPKKTFKTTIPNPEPEDDGDATDWNKQFEKAKKSADPLEVIKVKQAAFADGTVLN